MATKKGSQLEVKLVKSIIGSTVAQKKVADSLGLRKTNSVNILPNNESTKGMIKKLEHLLEVREV